MADLVVVAWVLPVDIEVGAPVVVAAVWAADCCLGP